MKKVSEFKVAKAAILSEIEQSALNGGRVVCGNSSTSYHGPDNPTSISTYVDGFPQGDDGTSGSGWGDSWATYLTAAPIGDGRLIISRMQ